MAKTIAEINEKIKKGQAVVVTADEMIDIAKKKGISQAAKEVDVVTTGTFGPMGSSGAYFNVGHTKPRVKLGGGRVSLKNVPAYGTDCYPRRSLETLINIKDMNEAVLFNVRNAYQNYNVAVNLSDRIIYTYMGVLKPKLGNANYSTSGQLSP